METLSTVLARLGEMLAGLRLLGDAGLSLLQRDAAVVVTPSRIASPPFNRAANL